jgi:hypothetical protein
VSTERDLKLVDQREDCGCEGVVGLRGMETVECLGVSGKSKIAGELREEFV